jgi:membrane protein
MAFYFFFAQFPVLLLLLILFSRTGGRAPDWQEALLNSFRQVLPPNASALMIHTIEQISGGAVAGTGAILAGAYAVWGALNGTWAAMTGLNKAYEVEEHRPWWRVVSIMFALTLVLTALALIALAAVVYGGSYVGAAANSGFLRRPIEWIVLIILVLFSFAVLYRFGPDVDDRRWQWSIPGAVVAVSFWAPATVLLRIYQEHFGSSRIYGGLTSVVTVLLWLYLTGAAIFVGGEANSELKKAAAKNR